MEEKKRSPRIAHLSWGRLEVEGKAGSYKDAKLFPGGSREWDWRETGTNHTPGVQPGDVQELLDRGATVVVLTKGINGRLQISPETTRFLSERGVRVHVFETDKAVDTYNELAETEPVGGLFHTTC